MDTRTPEQKAIIQSTARRMRIIAGPGTGKTSTLIDRYEADCESTIEAHKALIITYTVSAAREIAERLGKRSSYIGTLHGYLWSMVADKLVLLSEDQAYNAWCESAAYCNVKWSPKETALMKRNPSTREARIVAGHYRRICEDQKSVCLDSLIWGFTWEGLSASALYVDEAQDYSDSDWRTLGAIATERLVIVGDPKQAIFGFRGASRSWLTQAGAQEFSLTVGHRCAKNIAALAEKVLPSGLTATRPGGNVGIETWPTSDAELERILEIVAEYPEASIGILTRYNNGVAAIKGALGIEKPTIDRAKLLALLHLYQHPNSTSARSAWMRAQRKAVVRNAGGAIEIDFDPRDRLAQICADVRLTADEMALVLSLQHMETPEISAALAREGEEQSGRVWVGTIHGSKGREFDVVVLAGADLLPDKRSPLDDERRLFYVAITRAREVLHITSASTRAGSQRPKCPFLQ